MLQAMYSGVSGLQTQQSGIDVIGNNIANVNTVGYKSASVSFQDQLSQTIQAATAPTASGAGGQNPIQVGLGVSLGGIQTDQSQGNLQSTGNNSDLAIQGNGMFVVSNGSALSYTRDGSFSIDSSGTLVNPSTGQKVLGYPADSFGTINTTTSITPASTLTVPLGEIMPPQQTADIKFSGNLNASSALYSTKVDYSGNLNSAATASDTADNTVTVYDSLGNPHTVETIFSNPVSNPTGTGVPAGATQSWDVQVKVDGTTIYNSASGNAKAYETGSGLQFADSSGNLLGSSILLDGQNGANHAEQIPGANGASPLSLSLNYGSMTSAASASTLTGTADGQAGATPTWGASEQIYDSLGVAHMINFQYTRVPLSQNAPPGAQSEWTWTASENGNVISSSSSPNNTPLYFGSNGQLIAGSSQTIIVTPTNGSVSPFTVTLNNSALTQLSSDSNAQASSQNGSAAGTLQSYTIDSNGVLNGVFTNGQTKPLGQIALASFVNPGGLTNVGNNMYQPSSNSGTPQYGVANQNGNGSINPGYLEMSNVDLSSQFTNLIITQRGFEANTKIISTVNTMLQDVLGIIPG
jgi:flagellar hook protein FlgE